MSNWGRDAQRDSKTGLLNARAFDLRFAQAFAQAKRLRKPLSLLVIDLDGLKTVNDVNGHMVGDAILSAVGEIVRQHAHGRNIAGRFGGDEFVLALPGVASDEARLIAEHIRLSVSSARIRAIGSPQTISATISVGVAELARAQRTSGDLFHAADLALLHAKRMGRDQTFMAVHMCPAEPNIDVNAFLHRSSRKRRFDTI